MDEKYWSDLVRKWITESQLTHKELDAANARVAELVRRAEAAQQSSDEWYRQFAAAKAQLETAEAELAACQPFRVGEIVAVVNSPYSDVKNGTTAKVTGIKHDHMFTLGELSHTKFRTHELKKVSGG